MTVSIINWKRVRSKLRTDSWYLLGTDMPYTQVSRLQVGYLEGYEDIEVQTRRNHQVNGRRHCDVWLRLRGGD